MKELRCGDVVPGCPHEMRADTEDEVMAQAAEHAREAHGIDEVTPELAAQIQAKIHDA